MPLLAYHGQKEIKAKYLSRVLEHQQADEIIQGSYWQAQWNKGDIIGITVHSGNHGSFESELGIPHLVARLADRIFEMLPDPRFKEFPVEVLKAISVGAQLKLVPYKFLAWFISGSKYSLVFVEKHSHVQGDLTALAEYVKIRIERNPTDTEKAALNSSETNLKAVAEIKENFTARSAFAIITLFRDTRQAWACDHAIEYGKQAYLSHFTEREPQEVVYEFGNGLADKFLEILKAER